MAGVRISRGADRPHIERGASGSAATVRPTTGLLSGQLLEAHDAAVAAAAAAATAETNAETAETNAETAQAAAEVAQAAAEAVGSTNDAIIESRINDTTPSLTRAALTATFAALDLTAAGQQAVAETAPLRVSETDLTRRMALVPDGRTETDLIDGGSTQVWTVSACAVADDTAIRYPGFTQSKRVTISGAGTSYFYADPVFPSPAADPLIFPAASTVCALVWVDDPAKLTYLQVEIHETPGVNYWNRGTNNTEQTTAGDYLRYGWNFVRFKATGGTTTGWGSAARVRVIAVASAATAYNVQRVWVESPPKAQMMFIEDRGYKTFKDNGLADLRTLGANITWALDPTLLGAEVGTKNEVITQADVDTFYAAGDDVSLHAYDGSVTSTKTEAEIREDALRGVAYLQSNGYTRGRGWRAAWTQNQAPNAYAAKPYFAAYATWQASASSGADVWPFRDKWNVPRTGLHGRDNAYIDAMFAQLQTTHCLYTVYTHGIHTDGLTNGGADMTPTEWTYFMGKVTAAVSGGWLELVTFSQLLERSGGLVR